MGGMAQALATTVPNAELIQAVLDGQIVQVTPNEDGWTDMDPGVAIATLVRAAPGLRFRRKPQPVVRWLPLARTPGDGTVEVGPVYADTSEVPADLGGVPVLRLLRLELDPLTLEPLSVRCEPG